jgi:long-chain acyl-CoA synthetase
MSEVRGARSRPHPVEAGSIVPTDVVNRVALGSNQDTRHRILFGSDGVVDSLTLAELDRQAWRVARRLRALGVGPRDRVGVMAANRIEWVLVDLACLKLGAVVAGFEPGRFDARRLVADYGLWGVFVDCDAAAADVLHIDVVREWVEDAESLSTEPAVSEPLHVGYDPADICAVKFTSGSTGAPKGLEVTAGSINDSLESVQHLFQHGDGDNLLVFLRLALLQQRYWIYSALVNGHDVTIASIDDALPMAERACPTVVMGVPGFYEGLRSLVCSSLPVDADLASRRSAILQRLGGRIRYLWTGSAPASPAVLAFFNDCGVPLLEGYGLNETCIVAKNHPDAVRVGSVGKVLPNKTVRFDRDGVLIVGSRTPVNCRYTWCAPGTNERTFLPTGEVKTYDLGSIDEDGYLYIHGRTDDVLTLSSGRNVLVRLVEEKLREHPAVAECVLFGTGRDYLSAIISPAADEPDRAGLAQFVADVNEGLLPEQRVRALVIGEPFSIDNGLLSSQFKPRRADIHRRYAAELTAVYDGTDPGSASIVLVDATPDRQPTTSRG